MPLLPLLETAWGIDGADKNRNGKLGNRE